MCHTAIADDMLHITHYILHTTYCNMPTHGWKAKRRFPLKNYSTCPVSYTLPRRFTGFTGVFFLPFTGSFFCRFTGSFFCIADGRAALILVNQAQKTALQILQHFEDMLTGIWRHWIVFLIRDMTDTGCMVLVATIILGQPPWFIILGQPPWFIILGQPPWFIILGLCCLATLMLALC